MEEGQGESYTVSFPSVASLPLGHTPLNLTLFLMSSWVPVSVLPAISRFYQATTDNNMVPPRIVILMLTLPHSFWSRQCNPAAFSQEPTASLPISNLQG